MNDTESIEVVRFRPEFREVFVRLNRAWIEELFRLEPADLKSLEAPQQSIIECGGEIFVALASGVPIGVCAAIREDDANWELAKMAVDSGHRGRGVGEAVGKAVVEHVRAAGAERLYLVTNSSLHGAIRLYERLGFCHAELPAEPGYERADVHMEMFFGRLAAIRQPKV